VGWLDFDGAGRLVAVSGILDEVRVYDASGAIVGGFTRNDDLLGTGSNLKVADDGSYVVATQSFDGGDGGRQFQPDGTFVRQFGSGDVVGAAVIPESRLWIGTQESPVVTVYNLNSSVPVGSLSVAGMNGIRSMRFNPARNTVLIPDTLAGAVFEANLNGTLSQRYNAPTSFNGVTPGPNGDVLATTGGTATIWRWSADGTLIDTISTSSTLGGPADIAWAGIIPEPATALSAASAMLGFILGRARG
jgi:hypothetical protein